MTAPIGLDVGHSAVKLAAGDLKTVIPSAATEAMEISTATAKAAAKENTVTVDGTKWLVGEPAVTHTFGRLSNGLTDDWISTPEYAALVKAGFDKAVHAIGGTDVRLAVGLPSRLFKAQEKRLLEVVSSVTGVPRDHILTYPQPLAAFFVKALDAKGGPVVAKDGRSPIESSWAVIDVGYYTTDFGFVDAGTWAEAGSKSIPGVSAMAEQLLGVLTNEYGFDVSVRLADQALQARSIRYAGKVIDLREQVESIVSQFAANLCERAERVFSTYLYTAEGVLLVGGGADMVASALKARWKHAVVPERARFAVAEGLRRAAANLQDGEATAAGGDEK